MSKVKDILGLVVRSITKRILGTNVPPMPKADGTLLFHLKRIKDGVKAAYDALEEKKIVLSYPKNIDNLKNWILNINIPIARTNNEKNYVGLNEILMNDTSAVTELVDYETDFNKTPWNDRNNTNLKKVFPNLKKVTFGKIHGITNIKTAPNAVLIVPYYEELTLNITRCASGNNMSFMYVVNNSSTLKKLSFPYLEYGGGTYATLFSGLSALEEVYLPRYTGRDSATNRGWSASMSSSSLREIHLPEMTNGISHNSLLFVGGNLRKFYAPKLNCLGSDGVQNNAMFNTPLLEEAHFGKITSIGLGSSIFMKASKMEYLSLLEVGEGTTIFPRLHAWTATNVEDDLLNSNFKTYFAERLATWTDGSVHTLKFCQSFYDRLTEENKNILATKGWTITIEELA